MEGTVYPAWFCIYDQPISLRFVGVGSSNRSAFQEEGLGSFSGKSLSNSGREHAGDAYPRNSSFKGWITGCSSSSPKGLLLLLF
jgi:hypothetical protein